MNERLAHRFIVPLFFLDIGTTLCCLFLASYARQRLNIGKPLEDWQAHLPWPVYIAAALMWSLTFILLQPYRHILADGLLRVMRRLIVAVLLASLAFSGLLYLSLREISRLQFVYFVILDLCVLTLIHIGFWIYLRNNTYHQVLIASNRETAERLVALFKQNLPSYWRIVGYVSDEPENSDAIPRLGAIDEISALIADMHIDEIIFALPPQQYDRLSRLFLRLTGQPVRIHIVPSILDLMFVRTPVEMVGNIPLICLRESALTFEQRALKYCFDIVVSIILLLIFAPVMLIIACLIKLESRGPILFVQERIGENGRRFRMLKFRSMYVDAEQRWSEVVQRTEQGKLIHKWENDPRVTPLGRYLRRTSLDELPQLFNVLRGEMSLVGPRPEIPQIADEYEPWQWLRFRVMPGITGWWQINGRSKHPMHLHTHDDLYYIQNYSFWFDLQILIKTIAVVLHGRGAF